MTNVQSNDESVGTNTMLRSLKNLEGYQIHATDGNLGKVHDFLFDDESWVLRYLVVDTGHWLPGRKVLLSAGVLLSPDWYKSSFDVALTRDQVKTSPDIDTDQPVSRQHEMNLHRHYNWPVYWTGDGMIPGSVLASPPIPDAQVPSSTPTGDVHLRSVKEVCGYRIEATDGDFGFVEDFIAEEQTWALRYLVVTTHKWLPGRKVLISPRWLVGPISWAGRIVQVEMSKDSIKNSPQYNPATPVNREYETRLYDFYGRPHYWV